MLATLDPVPAAAPTTVPVVDALFWVACLVLVVAGATKLVSPSGVADTLSALGVGGTGTARLLGAVEALTAIVALTSGGPAPSLVVAVLYVGFAVVVVLARRRGLPSCGCFGARSAPPSMIHVVVDGVSAAVAVAAVATGPVDGPLPAGEGLAALGWSGVVVAALVVFASVLVVVVDTMVADVVEATRALRLQSDHDHDPGDVGGLTAGGT